MIAKYVEPEAYTLLLECNQMIHGLPSTLETSFS
uniref:Uncharacterized protein n=1 Tax=Arundo donax TaxID=35708 RepID=A0A0A8YFK9_ARUDO